MMNILLRIANRARLAWITISPLVKGWWSAANHYAWEIKDT